MKKLAVAMALLFLVGGASAVVGEDCPEGEVCIQDNETNQTSPPTQEYTPGNTMYYIAGMVSGIFMGVVGSGAVYYHKKD